MNSSGIPIRLQFDERVTTIIRSRMDYAFRVFAAIYDHPVADRVEGGPVLELIYGGPPLVDALGHERVRIPARYSLLTKQDYGAAPGKTRYAAEDLRLFHGLDPVTREPDWLGEIFEWLSGRWEKAIALRDSVGRIPDGEMIFARHGLPTWKPQAALHMSWLENVLRNGDGSPEALPKAPALTEHADHFVICTHDVDFYHTNRRDGLQRLLKNLGIALLLYRDASYFADNANMLVRLLSGKSIGEYLPPLVKRLQQHGCTSTFFVVPVHQHRRDPNYKLSDLPLSQVAGQSFPVELHASYTSVLGDRTLRSEVEALGKAIGKEPSGNRQHWLRFSDQTSLYRAVSNARLPFDSSVGFADTVGFRNGACFAFPPYNFDEEKPYEFLEVPLAIMDGSLFEISRATGEAPLVLADRILDESRKRGWGGISVLWHNPLEALSVPRAINQVFWTSLEKRQAFRENWVSTSEFLDLALSRYQRAGLLKHMPGQVYAPSDMFSAARSSRAWNRARNVAQSCV